MKGDRLFIREGALVHIGQHAHGTFDRAEIVQGLECLEGVGEILAVVVDAAQPRPPKKLVEELRDRYR